MCFSFLNGKSAMDQSVTLGVPHYFASYKLSDGSLVNVRIMDTAGMEHFRALNSSYYKSANCCLLVYDITDKASFEDLENYFNKNIKDFCIPNIPIIVLGNKTDLEEERKVSPIEGANFSLKYNYIFMETSCLKNENVSDAFETLIEITNREIMKNKTIISNDFRNEKIVIEEKKDEEKEKKKCYF